MNRPWLRTVSYFLFVLTCIIVTDQIWNMNFIESAIVGIIASLALDVIIDFYKVYRND
jgi:hypothetical protein